MWVIGTLLALLLVAALALWLAVQRNGHAVLDRVDAIVGPRSTVERVHEAQTGPDPLQQVIVYRPAGEVEPLPVFVFFHGGAWAHGSPQDYGFIGRNIAPRGYVVVLGGYRLNEDGRYPAMIEDTAAAIAWVHDNIARFGGDSTRMVLAGHSAGAYNVAQTVLEERWLDEAGVPAEAIRGVVGLAGPYDFHPFVTERTRAAFETVGAGADSQPIAHARADAPAFFLVHGEDDTVVRPRNSHALERALRARGAAVETLYLPGKGHNDPLLSLAHPWRRESQVIERVMQFVHARVSLSVPVKPETP